MGGYALVRRSGQAKACPEVLKICRMMTHAPLPTWSNLCRALLRRLPSDNDLAVPWHLEGELTGWLSRSTWSLALIALWRKSRAPASPVRVWVPDFFCNASLAALRRIGVKFTFYPLTDKMAPDMTACRTLAVADRPDLFVLVHYFGQPIPAAPARDFCARHGAWLIEDAVHVLRPVEGVGTFGDFVLYSPHKHLPIPDGAVLVARTGGSAQFRTADLASFGLPGTWPGQLRELQEELRDAVTNGGIHAGVWLAKRILQKLGLRRWPPSAVPFPEPPVADSTGLPQLTAPPQSSLGRRLLAVLLSDIEAVARHRQRHQLLWDALLLDGQASSPVSPVDRPRNREWTPYLASYGVVSATAEATYDQWQSKGLPVVSWPDRLPPEVTTHQECHRNAWHLRHSRLYLPVHPSLSVQLMSKRVASPYMLQNGEPCLTLAWDGVTRSEWQRWIAQCGRSNLLQSWAYGEAKSDNSGWQVKRAVFYRDHEPIAFVQVLQKSVAGLLRIARVNRGPLFLRILSKDEQRAVWEQLACLGSLRKRRVLTVAPELPLSGHCLAMMEDMGFRQYSLRNWESVWLDIQPGADQLRKRLDPKWRNKLTIAEKAGLKLDAGSDRARFDWMIDRYKEVMQEKGFTGPPIDLLLSLRRHASEEEPLLILQAMHEGEPVAGICLAYHGATATYLLSWNGDNGRKMRANQFLLWQAIMHLQQSGVRWFDLGGISEDSNPGITTFKLGLNGERYELVGEYWKW